jgi:hypothetical protein
MPASYRGSKKKTKSNMNMKKKLLNMKINGKKKRMSVPVKSETKTNMKKGVEANTKLNVTVKAQTSS